ncbi:AbrB/MazE/SpoVT family DNA-binding domain-containing protein [Paraburkholderia silviterrae]|uniref:AbrB/MazE/SpoVT family DNA-binding domain-containing protein n=1 Tax=Paraburkholderia silviterrae TaxID=2528715 RepID=A0A4R5MDM5_9BURK|nr:AbrB/MazE/SpoVT family DNA-binding domain-containing protein [Paraburkholderia silviterrae]TDG25192.1 AbrB/MazE/SpoVT family DNA-binding domain-containing protein [Paraburkholderia silviterrae]
MAIQTLKRWGNSLAVRIPASVAAKLALTEGQEIEVEVEDGVLTVRAHTAIRRFSRERYLRQLHESRLEQPPLIDFGAPQGFEFGGPDDPARFDLW